jgi:hypothetical protein
VTNKEGTIMTTYIEREPRKSDKIRAARFLAGQSLDDLLAVVRLDAYDAMPEDLAPIPAWNALAVRHWVYPDDGQPWVDYDILNNGDWLIYGPLHVLYVMTDERFRQEFEAVPE